MNELAGAITGVLAVTGVLLNNRKMIACFYVWMLSNALCGVLHVQAGMWSLAARDAVFFILAIDGAWRWRKGATA